MIEGHGGNIYALAEKLGCSPDEIIDMSSNMNPLGPPPGMLQWLTERISVIQSLPEADSGRLIRKFAKANDISPELVLAGSGTTQFIYSIPVSLGARNVLIVAPTYSDYADACAMYDIPFSCFFTEHERAFRPDWDRFERVVESFDTIFFCNPDNPTGVLTDRDILEKICRKYPDKFFVIDESYLPFVRDYESWSFIGIDLPNVIVLHSMSKIFRIPGLRTGFVVGPEEIIKKLARFRVPWNVNGPAQEAILFILDHPEEMRRFLRQTWDFFENETDRFLTVLNASDNMTAFPGAASFILIRLHPPFLARDIVERLKDERILIRDCSNFKGLSDRFIRVSLKDKKMNGIIAEKLVQMTRHVK